MLAMLMTHPDFFCARQVSGYHSNNAKQELLGVRGTYQYWSCSEKTVKMLEGYFYVLTQIWR